jgi:hypothetical protein
LGLDFGSRDYCLFELEQDKETVEMKKYLKILVLFLILVLIANITLLALNKISEILFWIVIIIAAVFVYKVLPRIKKS